MPSQQKVLVLTSKQGPFDIATIDVPTPAAGQLLIKVESTALNPIDWKIQVYGLFFETFPAILGLDAAGTVEAVGEGVTNFAKGDRVVFQGTFINDFAAFKQYTLAYAGVTAKIPSSVSFDEASTLSTGISTAALALYGKDAERSALLPAPWLSEGRNKLVGKPLLLLGGASSVGQFVLQFAKLSGFSPIIATASLHNTEYLKSLGATHVLDRKLSTDAIRAAVAEITSQPIDVVYDSISLPDTQETGYSVLAPGGTLIILLDEAVPEEKRGGNKKFAHVFGNANVPQNQDVGFSLWAHLPALLESGEIKPNKAEVVPGGLNGIVPGLERLKNNEVSAVKLVVHPQETA